MTYLCLHYLCQPQYAIKWLSQINSNLVNLSCLSRSFCPYSSYEMHSMFVAVCLASFLRRKPAVGQWSNIVLRRSTDKVSVVTGPRRRMAKILYGNGYSMAIVLDHKSTALTETKIAKAQPIWDVWPGQVFCTFAVCNWPSFHSICYKMLSVWECESDCFFSTSRQGMYSSYWTGFLSNQFGKVNLVSYLPYFISTNPIQASFLGIDRPEVHDQCHDWIIIMIFHDRSIMKCNEFKKCLYRDVLMNYLNSCFHLSSRQALLRTVLSNSMAIGGSAKVYRRMHWWERALWVRLQCTGVTSITESV